MPLLFSYGTLQHEDVQLSTFDRRLNGQWDMLPEFAPALVRIDDPELAERLGKTHHNNVTPNGDKNSHVPGMVFEVTDAELGRVDEYEAEFDYERVMATLGSGKHAWVYVHVDRPPA